MKTIKQFTEKSHIPNRTTVYNILAWFALEEVCRSYCDLMES